MAEEIAIKVGEEIVSGVVAQIKHQFSYLSQYHNNIENLSGKVENLTFKRQRVEERVAEARRNSQESEDDVKNWLEKVENVKAEAEGILKEKEKVGNGCWKGWCLNLKLRYRLSRKAVKEALPKLDELLLAEFVTVAKPQLPSGVVYEPTRNSDTRKQKIDDQGDEEPKEGIATSSEGTHGGLESRLKILRDVMVAMRDDRIRIVRICGMGGAGKTTMVKEVVKMARAERVFHEIAMVEVNQEPDLKTVQLHLAELLGLELKEDRLSTRADRLRQRLNDENKKILVILDNVWRREDLEEIGIPLEENKHSRCKILLTSRLDSLCKNVAPEQEFNIQVLPDEEALILFRQSLGNSPCYDQKAEELVKACGGLPIAIKTIARAVANESENSWTVAVEELHKSALEGEYPDVFNCLKVSYDLLKNEENKKFFRLCCLFPKGFDVPIEDLARYGMALRLFQDTDKLYMARNKAHRNVETLMHSNLLLGGDVKDCVKIHDLVWDFSVSTSSNGLFMVNHSDGLTDWPRRDSYEDYTAISLLCSGMNEVPEGLNFQNLKLLQLTGDWSNRSLKFPDNFYEGMGGLNVLAFTSMNVPLTPKSLQLLRNLRNLSLHECSLGDDDVSMIGNLGKLEVLSFAHSDVEKLPIEIGKLKGLRLLDLTGCNELCVIAPSVFPRLSSLEELYMRDTRFWLRDESRAIFTEIASMSNLVVIDIKIPYEVLPMDSLFAKLKKFNISVGYVRRWEDEYLFPNSLDLNCVSNVLLQDGIRSLLPQAERIYLVIPGLTTLLLLNDSETAEFSNLKSLSLDSCDELVYLVNAMGNLHQHNVFPLLDSLHLKRLPSLEEILHVWNTNESIVELTVTEVMDGPISTHSWIRSPQLAPFCNLKVLVVEMCNKLEYIFTLSAARDLVRLEEMYVSECDNLEVIFLKGRDDEVKIRLPNLKHLSLYKLPKLVGCYNAVDAIEFPQLVELELRGLPLLTSLIHPETETLASSHTDASSRHHLFIEKGPHTVCRFQNLRSLEVRSCNSLRHLLTPSTAISFGELQHLKVEHCESLQTIVAAESRKEGEEEEEESAMEVILLPRLNHLHLQSLQSLSTIFPKGYTLRWSSLKTLQLEFCGGESNIFANKNNIQRDTTTGHMIALTSLEKMEIYRMNSQELWHNHFPSGFSYELRDMIMDNCMELSVLLSPHLIRGFHHLKNLRLINSESLEVVFDLEEELIVGGGPKVAMLNKLGDIKIRNIPRMIHVWKKVPKNFEGFGNLTSLEVVRCGSLRYLFSPSIAKCLVKLKRVEIINCGVMEEVISKTWNEDGEEEEGQKKK